MSIKVLEVNVDDIGQGGVYSLVKNILKYKSDDISIDIATIEHFENEKNIDQFNKLGCKVHYIGSDRNKILKQFIVYKKLQLLLIEERYDCVHIHGDVSNKLFVSGLAAKSIGNNRIILHSHAAGVDGNRRMFKKFIHKICKSFLKKIGTDFLACSDLAAKWMYPNVSKQDVVMINNGVDLEKFRYHDLLRKRIRSELGISNELLIGHVGRFAYQKNHDYLIRVFKRVKEKIKDAKLILVGEGVLEKEIREQVEQLEISKDVIFYGITDRVYELFQAMDIFLLPSHFEGLPIVGVEAQAAGLPVIFSEEITQSAKLTEKVSFVPIENQDIDMWVEQIVNFKEAARCDTYDELVQKGFGIKNVVKSLEEIYRRGQ